MELQWRTAPSLRGLRGLAVFQLQNHRFQLLQLFGLTTTLQRLGRLSFAQHWGHLLLLTLLNRLKQGRNSLNSQKDMEVEQWFGGSFG
jgi:hypothetical protein